MRMVLLVSHEEGDSDSETDWAVLMVLGDKNAVAAKKKGKKKEKKRTHSTYPLRI
jgi:hypothetical protein